MQKAHVKLLKLLKTLEVWMKQERKKACRYKIIGQKIMKIEDVE